MPRVSPRARLCAPTPINMFQKVNPPTTKCARAPEPLLPLHIELGGGQGRTLPCFVLQHLHLTRSVYKIVLRKSTPPQIRQRILYYC